jgi:hypothetical protein
MIGGEPGMSNNADITTDFINAWQDYFDMGPFTE